jgi:hypothetical protein
MTQLTENLTVWELWYLKAVTSYRGERFQVPTRLTTVTRQTDEYKVDLTRHPKFPLALGERSFPTLSLTCQEDLFYVNCINQGWFWLEIKQLKINGK